MVSLFVFFFLIHSNSIIFKKYFFSTLSSLSLHRYKYFISLIKQFRLVVFFNLLRLPVIWSRLLLIYALLLNWVYSSFSRLYFVAVDILWEVAIDRIEPISINDYDWAFEFSNYLLIVCNLSINFNLFT